MTTPVSATSAAQAAPPPAVKAKAQFNASIVQASLSVSIQSSNEPLSVLLKTALTGINEALKDDYGDNAIQNAVSQDNSPEGTAGRIVSLSTAFYDAFKKQHTGEDEGDVLNQFIATLKKGVDQGFQEARGVLQGLSVLNGDIASNVDKTYELVQKGYADFIAAHQPQSAAPAASGDSKAAAPA